MPPGAGAGFGAPGFPPGGGAFPGSRRRGWGGGRQQHTVVSLALLLAQQVAGMERKPPLTLALAAVQVLFFLKPEGFEFVPSTRRGCLQPSAILGKGQWARLLWSPWLHADHLHLYYNMSSLLWKGGQLEPRLGLLPFGRLVAELALVSNALYLLLALGLARLAPGLGWALWRGCAVGFSGVLFGLKVVLNHDSPGWSEVAGVALPTKYVCWAELVLMQLLVPEASFWGHLCGILAGLLYVHVTSRLPFLPFGSPLGRRRGNGGSGAGSRGAAGMFRWLFGGRPRRARTYGRGTWGGGAAGAAGAAQVEQAAAAAGPSGGSSGSAGGSSRALGSSSSGGNGSGKAALRSSRGGSSRGALVMHLLPSHSTAVAATSVVLYSILAAALLSNPDADSLQQHVAALDHLQQQPAVWPLAPGPQSELWAPLKSPALLALEWLAGGGGGGSQAALPPAERYSFLLFSLGEVAGRWFLGGFGAWRQLPAALAPLAAAAAALVMAAAAAAGYAAVAVGWLVWLLRWQDGLGAARVLLEDSLAHMPPGTSALCTAFAAAWLLQQLLPRAAAQRWPAQQPDGSGSRGIRRAGAALAAGLAHPSLVHLSLNLLFVLVAGGAAERSLGAAVCRLGSGGSSSGLGRLQQLLSGSRASGGLWCSPTLAAVMFVAAFIAACMATRTSRRAQRLLGPAAGQVSSGADPGMRALLLALLAVEAWQQLLALLAALGAAPAAGSGSAADQLAAAALARLPQPWLLGAARLAATAARPLAAWRRGHGPSAVLLAAARIGAQQLMMMAPEQPRPSAAAPAAAGPRRQRQQQRPVGALRSVGAFLLDAVLLPLSPATSALRCRLQQRGCAILLLAALLAAVQALMLLAVQATLGVVSHTFIFAALQLCITALSSVLLVRSASSVGRAPCAVAPC